MRHTCRTRAAAPGCPTTLRRAHRADDDLEGLGGPWSRGRRWPGGGGFHGGDDDLAGEHEAALPYQEEPVPFDSLPKAAREAVLEQCPGAGGFDAVRLTQGEATCYNVLARRGRIEMSVTVSEAGEVIEFELDVSPSRLPKTVRATLEREYDGVEFDRISAVTMHFFELQYEGRHGERRVLQIDASGKVLADLEDDEGYGPEEFEE